jgi:hypothetical protein
MLAAMTGWVVMRPARTIRPVPAVASTPSDTQASHAPQRMTAPVEARRARMPVRPPPSAPISTTAYLAGLEGLARAFDAEARDALWAPGAEAALQRTTAAALGAEAAPAPLRDDLRVECRSSLCRLSVPIPNGRPITALPVAATMAQALQRAAPALAGAGNVVGERTEPTHPAAYRRYVLYWRRA